jgi:hypothetical protein
MRRRGFAKLAVSKWRDFRTLAWDFQDHIGIGSEDQEQIDGIDRFVMRENGPCSTGCDYDSQDAKL